MGKKKEAAKTTGGRNGRSHKGMAGFSLLAIIGLSVALFPPASLFALCVIPWICALLASRKMGRGLSLSVLCVSLAGTLPAVIMLAHRDMSSWSAVMGALAKPYPWICVFGAAALAWMIHGFLPMVVASISLQYYETRRASMKKCLADMKEEWGPEVEKTAGSDES